MSYSVGDALGVFPYNDPDEVSTWMDSLKMSDDSLDFVRGDGGNNPQQKTLTTHQLFTEVLDTFGKPSRRFYDFMSMAVEKEQDRQYLKHLLTKEGTPKLKEMANKEYVTHADLIQM